jgi:hypothetical protein
LRGSLVENRAIMQRIFLAAVLSALPVSLALATDISRLDPGDIVYKTGFTGVLAPDKVEVVRVEVSTNEVKVRDLESGVTEWVKADDLYTADELSSARVGAAVSSVAAAGESMTKTQASRVTDSCMADSSFQEEVVSRAVAEHASTGLTANYFCECLARKIAETETWDTSDAIARDFGNLRSLDRTAVENHISACLTAHTAAAQASGTAAAPESSATFVEPAPATDPTIDLNAIGTPPPAEAAATPVGLDDADAAAISAAEAATAPAPDAAANEPSAAKSSNLPLLLLGAAGVLGAGVFIGRKWGGGSTGPKT